MDYKKKQKINFFKNSEFDSENFANSFQEKHNDSYNELRKKVYELHKNNKIKNID
jgi:hypothetical protein